VVAADVSPEQVRRARQNVPEAEVMHVGALDLRLKPESLDAVVSQVPGGGVTRRRDRWLLRPR
jgi:hypothetical protein